MSTAKVWKVALVGGGRLGQYYAEAFTTFADTSLVAVVEPNYERAQAVVEKFPTSHGHFRDLHRMLDEAQPEIVTVATPGKYFQSVVLAAALAPSVRAIQVEKPFGGPLADADAMATACEAAGIVFAGGALTVAYPQVQEAAARLRSGEYGRVVGASVHGWSSEILGAGCQHTAVLRLLTGAEVVEVVAWCEQPEGLRDGEGRLVDAVDGAELETGCREPVGADCTEFNAQFRLATGLTVPVFGAPNLATTNLAGALPTAGVRVWTDTGYLVHAEGPECGPPQIFRGFDPQTKRRLRVEENYVVPPFVELPWPHLTNSCRTLIEHLVAVDSGASAVPPLAVSGIDIRQALELSTAAYHSALRGGVPMALPLLERDGDEAGGSPAIYPRGYRWGGGDSIGSIQSVEEVVSKGGRTWEGISTGFVDSGGGGTNKSAAAAEGGGGGEGGAAVEKL